MENKPTENKSPALMDRIGYVGMMFHKSFKFFLLRYVIPYLAVLLILAVFDDGRLVFGEVFAAVSSSLFYFYVFISYTKTEQYNNEHKDVYDNNGTYCAFCFLYIYGFYSMIAYSIINKYVATLPLQ